MTERRKKEWFDDDSFWREMYPFMFPEQRFAATPEEIAKVLSLTQPCGKVVLDLCCGPGRCSVALAKAGFTITGVDRTTFLLNKARGRARAAKVKIEWVQADMRDFIRANTFDLILSMFTSFGYFDDKEEDLRVLRNIFTSLKTGGICLIDVVGKERIAKIFQPTTSVDLADGTKLIQRHEIFDNWTRIRNEWILIKNGRAKTYSFHHTIYSGQELKDRMEAVGFADVNLYGNLDGDDYDPDSQRLVAVARKAGEAKTKRQRTKTPRKRNKQPA
jgi:SAM-dependent methyltransferase